MNSSVLPVYNRSSLTFDRGEGVYLYTPQNEKYLDFAAGIAVSAFGHSHPTLVKALTDQAKKVWHLSNLYTIPGLEDMAHKLADNTFADYVFFCNSGAEAVECGLKMVRKYHDETGNPEKYRVITFSGSFHGRTLATISAAAKEKVLKGFEPAVDGFDNVPFGDIDAVKAAIGPQTGGILIEPIQGEGGILPAEESFMKALRALADEHGLLLFLDEIQCGLGRTGTLFAYEQYGIKPDILASAKAIGGGFPLGACLCTKAVGDTMTPGSHGSTYGNNPLGMAVGNAVMDLLLADGCMEHVREIGAYLQDELTKLTESTPDNTTPQITEVRGKGLMVGIKIIPDNKEFVEKLRAKKLLTVAAGDNVIRLLPPLIIEKSHVDEAVSIIKSVCKDYQHD